MPSPPYSTSSIRYVEDALLAALLARPNLAAIAGPPQLGNPGAELLTEHVWIEGNVDAVQTWDVTAKGVNGKFPRGESYPLVVVVLVKQSGSDWPTVRNRCHDLAAEIETVVNADLTVAGAAFEIYTDTITRRDASDDQGRFCEIAYSLNVVAELA